MKKNTKISYRSPFLLTCIIAVSIVLNQLLFGTNGILNSVSAETTMSKRWLIVSLTHYLLLTGQSLLFLAIGYFGPTIKSKIQIVTKYWLVSVLAGLILMFGWMFWDQWSGSNVVWMVLFPISRNTYPLLTSASIGFLFVGLIDRIVAENVKRAVSVSTIVVVISTLFNQDIFSVQSGNTITTSFIFIMLGVTLRYTNLVNWNITKTIFASTFTVGLAFASLVVMIPISYFSNQGIGTVNRFIQPYSLLTYALAFFAFLVLIKGKNKKSSSKLSDIFYPSFSLIAVSVVFTMNPKFNWFTREVMNSSVPNLSRTHLFTFLGFLVLFLVSIYGLTIVINALLMTPLFTRIKGQIALILSRLINGQFRLILDEFTAWTQRHKAIIVALIWFYIMSVASIMLMHHSWVFDLSETQKLNMPTYVLFFREPVILFNLLFVGLLFGLLLVITRHYWVSLSTTTVLFGIFIIANVIKMKARSEPVLPADLAELTATGSLLKMVGTTIVVSVAVALIAIFCLTIWLERRFSHPLKLKLRGQILLVLFAIVTFGSTFFWNQNHSLFKGIATLTDDARMFYNQEQGAQTNGPLLQFLNNVDVTVMSKPKGYSRGKVAKVVQHYQREEKIINKERYSSLKDYTVVMNLSESFSDPNRVPNLKVTPNPLPYITQLKKETTSGIMLSSGYGGGTANMEYQSLTGLAISNFSPTLPTPYTQLVTNLKQAPAITNQFTYSAAIHPYYGIYYNRIAVYKKFGFDRFSYLGSKYPIKHQKKIGNNPYMSDQTAYENTLNQVNSRKGGQFINLITMQNHYPFNSNYYARHDYTAKGSAFLGDGAEQSIETYSQGLNYTDQAVRAFKAKIDKIKKPIIWVWYGDHLAGIYNGDSMSKYGLPLHETDYFIYANKYARTHGYKQTKAKFISPSDFPAMVMAQANAKVSAYYALLTRVHQNLPALTMNTSSDETNTLNSGTELINSTGKIVSQNDLSARQRHLLRDYRLIQYDIVAGKQYSLKMNFMK